MYHKIVKSEMRKTYSVVLSDSKSHNLVRSLIKLTEKSCQSLKIKGDLSETAAAPLPTPVRSSL